MKPIFELTECLSPEDIRLYRTNQLGDADRHRVEDHLLDCPLCQAAVEGQPTESDEAMASIFAKIDARVEQTAAPVRKLPFWTFNRIAATVLFLIVGTAVVWYAQSERGGISPDTNIALRGVAESLAKTSFPEGVDLYNNKNYRASLTYFEKALQEQPEDAVASFYAGLSALETGDLPTAEQYLRQARFNGDQIYEEASWSLVQVYRQLNQSESTKAVLQDLLKLDTPGTRKRAQQMLEELQ